MAIQKMYFMVKNQKFECLKSFLKYIKADGWWIPKAYTNDMIEISLANANFDLVYGHNNMYIASAEFD